MMSKLTFEVEVHFDGPEPDPIAMQDAIFDAIMRWRREGALTCADEEDTVVTDHVVHFT